jgi:DtxR family Mn-dependent transcriptional regulator
MVVDLLGIDLANAHIEAHRLEHAISPELEANIVSKLGDPKTCPFGHPIPGSGYTPSKDSIPLDNAAAGMDLVVDRIPEDDQALLEYLIDNRLIPGEIVTIQEAVASRGVITLICNNNQVAFSYTIGSKIWAIPQT